MTHQAATDHGTVLAPEQAALVVDPDGSFRLLLPNVAEGAEASDGHALITAIAMKLDDPEWAEGLFAELAAAVAKAKAN